MSDFWNNISRYPRFFIKRIDIWLWWELNLRPWAYESPALTTELQSLTISYYN